MIGVEKMIENNKKRTLEREKEKKWLKGKRKKR